MKINNRIDFLIFSILKTNDYYFYILSLLMIVLHAM